MNKMNSLLKHFKNWILSFSIKDVIYFAIIFLLIGALSFSVDRCSKVNHEYKNNIEALKDTIHYYKAKNGNLVATKLAFESDIKTLELLNEELYNEIENLKAKKDVTSATHFTGVIENPTQDTAYVVLHDTIDRGFEKDFAFNNEYRTLEGNVSYNEDTVGVNITKDEVNFDYTVAMDEDNNIYVTSSNPYVKYNQITGFQVPKPKKKHWFTGPAVSGGYDPIQNKPSLTIGWTIGYGLFSW